MRQLRGIVISALAGALLGMAGVSLAEPPPAVASGQGGTGATGGEGYTRVADKADGSVALEIASKSFVRADGKPGARVHLVGAVHIGDKAYYDALQSLLDRYDLVLFEGVKPPGAGAFDGTLDEAGKEKATRARLKFLLSVVEDERSRLGALPGSLDEAVDHAGKRWKTMIGSSLTDAWGRKVVYRVEPSDAGERAVVVSRGPDGVLQDEGGDDIRVEGTVSASRKTEKDAGLQAKMADALGLMFQLEGMDSSKPNWRSSDMSIDELQARFEAAGVAPDAFLKMLDGSSVMGRVAGWAMGLLKASPTLSANMKLMMVEMLGSGDEALTGSMPGNMKKIMSVILKDRNDVVISDLHRVLETESHGDVAIFYGAAHMADFEERLVRDFGYVRSGGHWLEAMSVSPSSLGMTPEQLKKQREAKKKAAERAALRAAERKKSPETSR